MKHYDIIIIGAGIAGMTAAIYLRRAGKSVLVLEEKTHGGQINDSLHVENWPGEISISGADLTEKIYHQMNNLGADLHYEQVEKIMSTPENNKFTIKTDEAEYSSDAIIIATGTKPRELGEKQKQEAGTRPISYCATCDGALYKDQPVVVIGSGNTAKYEIKYLENIASKVYHIHHDDKIPADAKAIFVAIGRVPNTKIAENLVELDDNNYIKAGEDCKTTHSGIFAAGDCRTKQTRQLVTAAGDGAAAARSALDYLNEQCA